MTGIRSQRGMKIVAGGGTMRRLFALFRDFECYGDLATIIPVQGGEFGSKPVQTVASLRGIALAARDERFSSPERLRQG